MRYTQQRRICAGRVTAGLCRALLVKMCIIVIRCYYFTVDSGTVVKLALAFSHRRDLWRRATCVSQNL